MAGPLYPTKIPGAAPGEASTSAPRIPDAADTGRVAPTPAVVFGDDDHALPPLDDEDDGGGPLGGMVQLAQYGGEQPTPRAAPPADQVHEDDISWLFRVTGGGQPPRHQPDREWPTHVRDVFRASPRAQAPVAPRLDERYRVAQVERQQESDLDWLMRMTGGYPQPQQQPTGQGGPTLRDPQPGDLEPIAPLPAPAAAPAAPQQGEAAAPATPQAHLRGILERGAGPPSDTASYAASSRWWGEQSERVWSFLQGLTETRRQMLNTMGGGMSPLAARRSGTGNAVQDWLESKVKGNIGEAQRRQTEADEIAAGTRPGPQTGLAQEMGRDAARGGIGLAASTIKGAAYGWEWARGGRMSDAAEANIYQVGAVMDEWAKQTFPDDPARQHEFTGMLAEGFGSMVTFLGPGLATQILVRGGPRAMALIMGGTSGTTGALGSAGTMEDAALRAMREGRTVGGEAVNEETLRRIFPMAIGIGATEAAPIARFFNRTGGQMATRILSQALEEGGQEFTQSVLENVTARANYDDLRQWDDGAWSGLAVGTLLGGAMQGGAELRGNIREARVGGTRTDAGQPPLPGTPGAPTPTPGPPPAPAPAASPRDALEALESSAGAPLVEQVAPQPAPRAERRAPDPELTRWMFDTLRQGEWQAPAAPAAPTPPVNLNMVRLTEDEAQMAVQALWVQPDAPRGIPSMLEPTAVQQATRAALEGEQTLRRRIGDANTNALIADVTAHARQGRPSYDQVLDYVQDRYAIGGGTPVRLDIRRNAGAGDDWLAEHWNDIARRATAGEVSAYYRGDAVAARASRPAPRAAITAQAEDLEQQLRGYERSIADKPIKEQAAAIRRKFGFFVDPEDLRTGNVFWRVGEGGQIQFAAGGPSAPMRSRARGFWDDLNAAQRAAFAEMWGAQNITAADLTAFVKQHTGRTITAKGLTEFGARNRELFRARTFTGWTSERLQEFARLWKEGRSIDEIEAHFRASDFPVSEPILYRTARERPDLFPERRGPVGGAILGRLSGEERAQFRELWNRTETTASELQDFVEKATGSRPSVSVLEKLTQRHPDEFPPRGRSRIDWTAPRLAEVERLWHAGESAEAIAAHLAESGFSVHPRTIRNLVADDRGRFPKRSKTVPEDARALLELPRVMAMDDADAAKAISESLGRPVLVIAVQAGRKRYGLTLTPEQRASLREAMTNQIEPTPNALQSFTEADATDEVRALLRSGKPIVFDVAPNVVEHVLREIGPMQGLVPAGFQVGTLVRVRPTKYEGYVGATYALLGGGEVTFGVPKTSLLDAAWAAKPRPPEYLVKHRFIGLNRLTLPLAAEFEPAGFLGRSNPLSDLNRSLRAGVAHEIVHTVFTDLDNTLQLRLVGHAERLRVMDITVENYLRATGRGDLAEDVAGLATTRRKQYQAIYAGRANQASLMDEEAVAHLVTLAHAGALPRAVMDEIAGDLEAMFAHDMNVGRSAPPPVATTVGDMPVPMRRGRELITFNAGAELPDALRGIPSFDDIEARLPKDADGHPDVAHLQRRMIEATGKDRWGALTAAEKAQLYRDLGGESTAAAGAGAGASPAPPGSGLDGIPSVPAGAGGAPPVPTAGAAQPPPLPPGGRPPSGPPGIPPALPGAGGSPPLPPGQFSREFKFNWGAIEGQDQVKAMAGQLMDTFRDEMVARGVSGGGRGYVQSWQETAKKAGMLDAVELMFRRGREGGRTYDAVGMEALGTLYVSSMEKLKEIVTQAASPNATPRDMVAMQHMLTVHRQIQKEFWGGVSEAGRTLNILRKTKGASQEYSRGLEEILRNTGGIGTNSALAQSLADFLGRGDYAGADRFIERSRFAKGVDAIIEAWKGGLLHGPLTHIVNFMSNSTIIPLSVIERMLAGTIGLAHRDSGVQLGEAWAMMAGMRRSMREALAAAWESLRTGQQRFGEAQLEAPRLPRTSAEVLGVNTPQAWQAQGQTGDLNRLGALLQGQTYREMIQRPSTMAGLGLDMLSLYATYGFRFLGASDSFFKVLHNGAELGAQAHRQASHEAMHGQIPHTTAAVRARAAQLYDQATDPSNQSEAAQAMRIASREMAEYNTFTNQPGPITRAIELLRDPTWNRLQEGGEPHPLYRLFTHMAFPFTRTPGNLMAFGVFDRSPVGFLARKFYREVGAGGARADLALARMGLGIAAFTVMLDLFFDGLLTGPAPDDPRERDALLRSGWRALSLKLPTGTNSDGSPSFTYVPLQRLDPISATPILAAEFGALLRGRNMNYDDEDVQRAWTAAAFAISETALEKPTLQGIANLAKAIVRPEQFAHAWAQRQAASFIPADVNYIRQRMDPVSRETWDYVSSLQNRTPGLSSDLPPRLDFWGRVQTNESGFGPWFDALSPVFARSNTGAQPIDREFFRLNYFPGHPHSLSVMRSDAAERALQGLPTQRRRGLDALIAAQPDDPMRGESNVVPLRGLPQVENRLISLTSATPASKLLDENQQYLIAARHGDVLPRLMRYGDQTLLQVLNDLVTKDPDYRQARDDQQMQAIKDVIADYRTAARAQTVREFPELQARRDRMSTRAQKARQAPF